MLLTPSRCARCWLAVLLALAWPAMAGVYRWRDSDGRMHYGDQPPAGVQAEALPVDPAPPPRSAADAERRLLEDAERRAADTARGRSEARRREARAEAERERRCSRLDERRRQLETGFAERRARGYTMAQERSYRSRLDALERELKSGCR